MKNLLACCCILILMLPAVADTSVARGAMAQYKVEMDAAKESALKGDAKSAASHEDGARKYLKQASTEFAAADAGESDDVSVLRDYANVCVKMDDYDLAVQAFERATGIQPDDAGLWLSLGYALMELGPSRANDAAAAYRKTIELNPASETLAGAYVGLGDLYRRQSLHRLARECNQKALEAKPDMRAARLAIAAARVRDGEVLEAANEIDALGVMTGEEASLLGALLPESLQAFELARLTFPDTHEHHLAYAKLLLRAGRNPQALVAAEKAAALGPADYVTWNMVGGLSRQAGNVARAKEAYTKSLEINPDQPRTKEALQALGK